MDIQFVNSLQNKERKPRKKKYKMKDIFDTKKKKLCCCERKKNKKKY